MATSPPVKIRVMVVDDSAVIRGLFSTMLESDPDITVVASANNGEMALNLLRRSGENKVEVDVVTLDIQMPVMDGLVALPEILKLSPRAKVIMASTLTSEGASETVRALALGAADYIAKPSSTRDREAMYQFSQDLINKVRALGGLSEHPAGAAGSTAPAPDPMPMPKIATAARSQKTEEIVLRSSAGMKRPEAIAIGCSTGGPQALMTLFKALKGKRFQVPVFITQHMPPQFTTMLAAQIVEVCGIPSGEGKEGEIAQPGHIYLAPGDYHMVVKRDGSRAMLHLNQNPPENFCRPAVDPMLRSLAEFYGDRLLVLIMTGMGADGMAGSKAVVEQGGHVFAQDKATSVVWGMPGAVATAGLCCKLVPLAEIAGTLISLSQGQIA